MVLEVARSSLSLQRLASVLVTGISGLVLIKAGRQTSDPQKVEMLGVCSYDSSRLSCWTPSGRRDGELTRRIDRALRSRSEYSFQYRYGMKNRLLIFEQSGKGYVSFSSPGDNSISSSDIRSDGLGPTMKLLPISADPERKTGSVSAVAQTNELAGSAAGPLKDGVALTMGSASVTIGLAQIQPNSSYSPPGAPPPPRRSYTYPLATSSPPGTVLELRATAYDLKGNVVENVDPDGKPIPLPPPNPNGNREYNSSYGNGYGNVLYVGRTDDRSATLFTTIDPAEIRELRWAANLNRRYEYKDFALDPKR